jgi:precorrin-6B methylase 2
MSIFVSIANRGFVLTSGDVVIPKLTPLFVFFAPVSIMTPPQLLNKRTMKKVLITGANKSIGFETARQLLQKGYYVYLGSRNLENGLEAVAKLKAEGLNEVEAIQIDVSDGESVKAARAQIGKKPKNWMC